jgi:hypothetical protein
MLELPEEFNKASDELEVQIAFGQADRLARLTRDL